MIPGDVRLMLASHAHLLWLAERSKVKSKIKVWWNREQWFLSSHCMGRIEEPFTTDSWLTMCRFERRGDKIYPIIDWSCTSYGAYVNRLDCPLRRPRRGYPFDDEHPSKRIATKPRKRFNKKSFQGFAEKMKKPKWQSQRKF